MCNEILNCKFKKDLKTNVKIVCQKCNKEMILYQNGFKRKLNKFQKKYSEAGNKIYVWAAIIIAILLIIFWITEFKEGTIWVPIVK